MAYITRTDLKDRYGEAEIAQRESMLPAGAVDRAISDADAEIDGYLAGRYAVPLSPVPTLIQRLACDIARYRLLGGAAGEEARARYKDASRVLAEIGAGRVSIGAPTATSQTTGTVMVAGGDRHFSRENR